MPRPLHFWGAVDKLLFCCLAFELPRPPRSPFCFPQTPQSLRPPTPPMRKNIHHHQRSPTSGKRFAMHYALNPVHKLDPLGARPMSPRSLCLEASPITSPSVVARHDGHDMESQNLHLQHQQPSQATQGQSLQLRHQQPSPNLYLQYQQLPQPTPSQNLQHQHHQPPQLPPASTKFRVEKPLPLAPVMAGTHSSTTTTATTAVALGETAGSGYSSQRRPLSVADLCTPADTGYSSESASPGARRPLSVADLCSASPSSPVPDEMNVEMAPEPTRTPRPTPQPDFPCIFAFAGCDSTFNSKRHWKRHVKTHHILPKYWVCRNGACLFVKSPVLVAAEAAAAAARLPLHMGFYCRLAPRFDVRAANPVSGTPPAYSISAISRVAARGSVFNRKDVYKYHVSRVHFPPHSWPDEQWWSDATSSAEKERCQLPKNLPCPTVGCPVVLADFDNWMEHLGVHLQMSIGQTDTIMAGINGETDHPLITWAAGSDVAIIARFCERWVLSHTILPIGEGGNIVA
ncbi:hypothetical protein MAPG_10581 [Magnaporthiopsis poae ATCC 64411]|uniref:C2H2-type domain-containing protein n=1 Tax=Magnaporthiopsis poae (strain ATCC 64411 / 73-15) TaxID=644358 RepID=A0A0C4ECZ2_MAGP6|nr:hypothetical protein MAPG_10581 [Magnaporthiopsis poae ATCC 64411]